MLWHKPLNPTVEREVKAESIGSMQCVRRLDLETPKATERTGEAKRRDPSITNSELLVLLATSNSMPLPLLNQTT